MAREKVMAKCPCCETNLSDQTFFINRYTPDEISVIYPKGHAEFPEGKSLTQLEDLERNVEKRGEKYGITRRDIVLINVGKKQFAVFPSADGKPFGNGMKYLTRAGKQEAKRMNQILIEGSKIHPIYKHYFLDW